MPASPVLFQSGPQAPQFPYLPNLEEIGEPMGSLTMSATPAGMSVPSHRIQCQCDLPGQMALEEIGIDQAMDAPILPVSLLPAGGISSIDHLPGERLDRLVQILHL